MGALIQLQRQDLLTGVVEVVYSGTEQALLFFNLGAPFALYYLADGAWRKIPSTHWTDIFSFSNGEAGVLPLGGDSLRILMMALEAGSSPSEELLLRPEGLTTYIEQVKARETATLLRLRDEQFYGLIVLPGKRIPVQDVAVFSPEGILTDSKGMTRLTAAKDELIHVSQVEFDGLPSSMQEYALRVVFLALTQPMLKRFDELAGDTLTESLDQEINSYAFHQGWKIQFFGDQVSHRQFFQELSEAFLVYRSLFRVMRHYIHRVVGASLAANIVNEGVGRLPYAYREIFERQNFIVV